jgi:hypothetical protein
MMHKSKIKELPPEPKPKKELKADATSVRQTIAKHNVRRRLSIKNRLIERLNEQFGLNIPYDYIARTHQRKFSDSGGHNWYFNGKDIMINKYGSCYTMSELLKYKK